MVQIVVTFEVDDEHIGSDWGSYGRRLDGELLRIQNNSEVGLRVTDATITAGDLPETHLYSRAQLKKMARS